MKKVLFVTMINSLTEKIFKTVSLTYEAQLCPDDPEQVEVMLRFFKPDLVIFCLAGQDKSCLEIFPYIDQYREKMPMILLGTVGELRIVQNIARLQWVHCLERPVDNERLIAECKACLSNGEEEKVEKKTIMIVDDSPILLRSMKKILEPEFVTMLATGGPQAFMQMSKKKPDLIILDYEMPTYNGEMVFRELRSSDKWNDIPVVFLTGVSDKEHILSILALEPAGYFLKPPVTDQIIAKIRQVLGC